MIEGDGGYSVAGVYMVTISSEMTSISLKIFYPVNYKTLKIMKKLTVGKNLFEFARANTASCRLPYQLSHVTPSINHSNYTDLNLSLIH